VKRYALTAAGHVFDALDTLGTPWLVPGQAWYETRAGPAELHAGGALAYHDPPAGGSSCGCGQAPHARHPAANRWALTAA